MKYILFLIIFIFSSGHYAVASLYYDSISPDVAAHQGYTTDGAYHYSIHTDHIYKRSLTDWSVVSENATPFSGLSGINHLGGGDISGGVLFIATETYASCVSFSGQRILKYSTNDLSYIGQSDISAQGIEVSAVAVDNARGEIYVSSFCTGTRIDRYSLDDLSFIGSITLSSAITQIQGITYFNNKIYIANNSGNLYQSDLSGNVSYIGSTGLTTGSNEGVKYFGNRLFWLYDDMSGSERVYSYVIHNYLQMSGVQLYQIGYQ
jgi:hypothetical protein